MPDRTLLLRWAADTWRSFEAMTDPGHRPADRQHRRLARPRDPQRLHLADQHRRPALVHRRRSRPRARARRRGPRPARPAAHDARRDGGARRVGDVLQLVRRPFGRPAAADARQRARDPAVPLERRQRLARGRAHGGRGSRATPVAEAATPCSTAWTSASSTTQPPGRTGPADASPAASGSTTRASRRAGPPSSPGTRTSSTPRHHYDLLDSEPRIASYVGIAHGQIPPEHYAALDAPLRHYRGRDVVPTFGGSMFEALMPTIFVPEATWAPRHVGRQRGAHRGPPA